MPRRQDIEKRIPVEGTNLTAKERALLPDPTGSRKTMRMQS